MSIKSSEHYKEKFTGKKNYFFTLLDKTKDAFVKDKIEPSVEIEKLYNGYLEKVNVFHNEEKVLNDKFKKDNEILNDNIDKLNKNLEEEKNEFEKKKKKYLQLTQLDNAFEQSYEDSIYDYNYNLVYMISLVGVSILMLYSAK